MISELQDSIIRLKAVHKRTGLSRSTMYLKAGRGIDCATPCSLLSNTDNSLHTTTRCVASMAATAQGAVWRVLQTGSAPPPTDVGKPAEPSSLRCPTFAAPAQ